MSELYEIPGDVDELFAGGKCSYQIRDPEQSGDNIFAMQLFMDEVGIEDALVEEHNETQVILNRGGQRLCIDSGGLGDFHLHGYDVTVLESVRTESDIPCCKCGGPVVEFTVPNQAWNTIVRRGGPETDQEYLCLDCFARIAADEIDRLQAILGEPVTNIEICKLPHQNLPFVYGVRNGNDVWLLSDGRWTEQDGHPDASIPCHDSTAEAALAAKEGGVS